MKISIKYFVPLLLLLIAPQVFSKSEGMPSFKFDFGTGEVEKGYTAVGPQSIYSDKTDYGFDFGTMPQFVNRKKYGALREDAATADQPFYFSVKVPEGNYKITVVLGDAKGTSKTWIKAESRRLMVKDAETKKGKFRSETFIVNIKDRNIFNTGKQVGLKPREYHKLDWDDKLTLEFDGHTSI